MIFIDVIEILKNGELFSIVVSRFDEANMVGSRSSLACSSEIAKSDAREKADTFRAAGRAVKVRWTTEGGL